MEWLTSVANEVQALRSQKAALEWYMFPKTWELQFLKSGSNNCSRSSYLNEQERSSNSPRFEEATFCCTWKTVKTGQISASLALLPIIMNSGEWEWKTDYRTWTQVRDMRNSWKCSWLFLWFYCFFWVCPPVSIVPMHDSVKRVQFSHFLSISFLLHTICTEFNCTLVGLLLFSVKYGNTFTVTTIK